MISVNQSYNPSHLPCRTRLLAHRNDCRCDYTTCLAATKRTECAVHFCDFECSVATNHYFGIKNSLVAAEGLGRHAPIVLSVGDLSRQTSIRPREQDRASPLWFQDTVLYMMMLLSERVDFQVPGKRSLCGGET